MSKGDKANSVLVFCYISMRSAQRIIKGSAEPRPLPELPPRGTRHSTQPALPFREHGSSSAVLLKSLKAQLAVFRETAIWCSRISRLCIHFFSCPFYVCLISLWLLYAIVNAGFQVINAYMQMPSGGTGYAYFSVFDLYISWIEKAPPFSFVACMAISSASGPSSFLARGNWVSWSNNCLCLRQKRI